MARKPSMKATLLPTPKPLLTGHTIWTQEAGSTEMDSPLLLLAKGVEQLG